MAVETGILLESGTNELELLEFVVGNQHYGINVDVSTENVELAKNQIKYYTLMNSISQEFSRMKSALKTS